MAKCRACHRVVRFVALAQGGHVPVEPNPDEMGTLAARRVGSELVDGRFLARGELVAEGEGRWLPHRETCTQAGWPRSGAPRPAALGGRQPQLVFGH